MSVRDVKLEVPEAKGESLQLDLDRPTAVEIFDQVARNGRHELKRTNLTLALSGIVGGLTMGLTPLAVSIVAARLGGGSAAQIAGFLLYPLGFIAVILGRGQLFTENTLYPVALILAERRHVLNTARLWGIVFPANVIGTLLFALLAVRTAALDPPVVQALTRMGMEAAAPSMTHIFWSAVMGGWIIAMMAWLVSGSHSITGSVAVIWMLTFVVGLGHFAHCIATSGEILSAVLSHALPWKDYARWIFPAVCGNIAGGVVLVTLFEYGQTRLRS